MLKEIKFSPACRIVLAPWEAEALLALPYSRNTLLEDLVRVEVGHSRGYAFYSHRTLKIWSPSYCVKALDSRELISSIEASLPDESDLRDEKLIAYEDGQWKPLEIRGLHYYKLLPTRRGAPPSIEIDGIHMHRVSGTDPWRDTLAKVRAARIGTGDVVLDTCMGLGYTAIASSMLGARMVYTVEIDEMVITLARYNPWSIELSNKNIIIYNNDITQIIYNFRENYFSKIIHDPPRITSSTGKLYSLEFYRELYRVLKPGGILFHYTGEPGRKHGSNFPGRIGGKLKKIGFRHVRYVKSALGIVARK